MSCIALTGINKINENNLTGKSIISNNTQEPYYITRLKQVIFNRFITPVFTNNWKIVEQNMFSLQEIRNKLAKYINQANGEDLQIYLSFLDIIVELLAEHNHFEKLENMYNPNNTVGTIRFKVPKIRLQPEYELYKLIIGRPHKSVGYNEEILSYIKTLLNREYIEYSDIQKKVKERFNV